VQLVALKVPVEFEVKVTVPVGVPLVAVTVAVQVEAVLSGTLAGLQDTAVEVPPELTVRRNVPLLPLWTLSPPYVPAMSAWPVVVCEYVTLHVPEDSVQLVALNVPVLLLVKVTVPVGVIAPAPEPSATVTVHVEA